MLSVKYINSRIYAGVLGKTIGVRLGAPVEPLIWTYDRIRDTYGDITGYLRDFKNFAADDDTNGPVYFIRAMRDYQLKPSAQEVAKTWLNYAADGHGMYWWGGYGISTEHTAYLNLKAGIAAPRSGSIEQNGATIAEQIGGQIFIDSWGWVNPGNPKQAAEMSATAASVAHDGDGINGAKFVAAMIARAFDAQNVAQIYDSGMAAIPADSSYARVAGAVRDFHHQNQDDWRACMDMLTAEFGYDRYPGICHMIPNAGVLALAVLYGEGDLCRTVEIATMCGWDTDCNAGNAGAIIGTFQGLQPSWDKYRKPINDVIIASGVTGTLNIVDIPNFARELTTLGQKLAAKSVPESMEKELTRRGLCFDFEQSGSTHGFRTAGCNKLNLAWSDKQSGDGCGSIKILADRMAQGQNGRVFYKPFYRPDDFDDERYRPMFSPQIAAGQQVKFDLFCEPFEGEGLRVAPYVRRAMSGKIDQIGGWNEPDNGAWKTYNFVVPDAGNEAIDEVGFLVEYFGRLKFTGALYLANFEVSGTGKTTIIPAQETQEWGAISRFTWNRGAWKLEDNQITCLTADNADLWTGHAYATNYITRAKIIPLAGESHLLSARAQGAERFYAAGFDGGRLVILHEDFGSKILAEIPMSMTHGEEYLLEFAVHGHDLNLSLNGKLMLSATDETFAYGMAGLRMGSAGRMSASFFEIEEV